MTRPEAARAALAAALRERLGLDRRGLLVAAAVCNAELLVVLGYLVAVGPRVTRPLLYAYPFVWLNVALWAVWRVNSPDAPARRRLTAGALALGYLAVLAFAGGLVGPGGHPTGLRVVTASLPPGWSPALVYGGEAVRFALLPFKVSGYLTLAYLLYATLLEAAGSAAGAVVGLFSCVSCVLPVLAGVASGLAGAGGALVAAAGAQTYGLSTVAFVVTVGLLVWRPTTADLAGLYGRL